MKYVTNFILACLFVSYCVFGSFGVAQTNLPPTPQPQYTLTLTLSPINVPGVKNSVTGVETDPKFFLTPNNVVGPTTIVSPDFSFVGGRYDRVFPQVSKFINNLSPSLNGYNFTCGLTGSLGVVYSPNGTGGTQQHWGERAGGFCNYSFNGTVSVGAEGQINNLVGYERWAPSLSIGPQFHF